MDQHRRMVGTRIVVVGTTGSGKSTLARGLARNRGFACVELDALNWEPDWVDADLDVFRSRVREALSTAPGGWVVDGNYLAKVEDLIWPLADTIVWIDLPFRIVLTRLSRRTARRMITREELWSGNRERARTLVTRDSIILWAVRTHRANRRRMIDRAADPAYSHLEFVRLTSSAAVSRLMEPS